MKKIVSAVLAACFLIACSKHVTVQSNPPGARVLVNGQDYGVTPAQMDLSYTTFSDFRVELRKDGYEPYHGSLAQDLNMGQLIIGIICCWPALLWVQSPNDVQNYTLNPLPGTPQDWGKGGSGAQPSPTPAGTEL